MKKHTICLATAALIAAGSSVMAHAADPMIFAPGVISSSANDVAPAFTPDGKTVFFTRHNGSDYDILVSHRMHHGWSEPKIASFSGRWRDLEPAMAPDGSYMIFASSRPLPGTNTAPDGTWGGHNHPGKGGNLWRVDRTNHGWSKPKRLPDIINRSTNVFSPSIAANGDLYFMQAYGEGGHFRIFCSRFVNGHYQPLEILPFTAGQYGGADETVAPDESFMVFSSSRPPTPAQQGDLFIIFRKNGKWGKPQHLPEAINHLASNFESRLGPDGHILYFSSGYIVPAQMPKDPAAARLSLKNMLSWNNGNQNIWYVDLGPYLKSQH